MRTGDMPEPELLPKCVGCGQTYAFNLGGGDFEEDILESEVCGCVCVYVWLCEVSGRKLYEFEVVWVNGVVLSASVYMRVFIIFTFAYEQTRVWVCRSNICLSLDNQQTNQPTNQPSNKSTSAYWSCSDREGPSASCKCR